MVGMPGVRRDVLQWLVALNLSFPIRNLRRDFSNGFLIAEIFSRYFPTGIQMHSFDTGNSIAKKRNNWSQLEKFFKKKSFHILKDEIENIINCDANEGAGLLLDRMYGFLTHKRCTQIQIDGNGQDLWLGLPQSSDERDASNTESCGREPHQETCFDSQIYSDSCYDDNYDHQRSEEDNLRRFHTVTKGHDDRRGVSSKNDGDSKRGDDPGGVGSCPGQVECRTDHFRTAYVYNQDSKPGARVCYHDCLPTRITSGCSDSNPISSAENAMYYRDSVACPLTREVPNVQMLREAGNLHGQSQRETALQLYPEDHLRRFADENANQGGNVICCTDEKHLLLLKNKFNCRQSSKTLVPLSAVQRARLKENKRVKQSAKDNLDPRVTDVKERQWKQDANRSAGLAFRSLNRQRQFKQYTLADWRKQQSMTGHVHLGGLGPKNTEKLDVQKEMYEKVKHFARSVLVANLSKELEPKEKKATKLVSSRDKAKEFASKIPKPKVKKVTSTCQNDEDPDGYTHVPSELEMLENQYHVDKQKFEAMRRDLELFLR